MSARTWQPGDVAMVTVGGQEVRGFVDDNAWRFAGHRFFKSVALNNEVYVDSARPLVVIDPEDREQVKRLTKLFPVSWQLDQFDDPEVLDDSVKCIQAALREFAAPTPPKPEEPLGLGAVVRDDAGDVWVRADDDDMPWVKAGSESWKRWDQLDVSSPDQILSAGWSEGGAR